MGIPKFAKTLMRRYPLIVGNIKNDSDIPPIDNLYLDINSVLHLLSHSREHNLLALTKKKTDEQIYEETCEFINQIVKLIKPKNFLMIVLDGVCPIAKISNQVISRYVSSLYKFDEIDNFLKDINLEKINDFDGNKIFPCTKFMIDFEKYLDGYIAKKKEKCDGWEKIDIVFSGTNIPGEGEYKIISQIREQKNIEKNNNIENNNNCSKYCIFSGDADFILLSLLIHEPNIVILKSGTFNKTKYNFEFNEDNNKLLFNEFIYISVLREYLSLEFNDIKKFFEKNIEKNYDIERIYEDFSFICLLLGNDYIPGILSLDTSDEIFEILVSSYKKSIKNYDKTDNYLINNKGKINFQNFQSFIKELFDKEVDYIKLKNKAFKAFKKPKYKSTNCILTLTGLYKESLKNNAESKNKSTYDKLKNVMNSDKNFVSRINNIINLTIMKYDKENSKKYEETFINKFKKKYKNDKFKAEIMYYKEKFNIDIENILDKKKLKNIIINYLAGLQWNIYYYKGFLNWNYNYKYCYSPLILSLSKFEYNKNLSNIEDAIYENNVEEEKKEGAPLPPYILQCLNFPYDLNSCNLIHPLYKEIVKIIPEYYNFKISIDNNGFSFHSQTTVICPKIEGKEMIKKLIDFDKKNFEKTDDYKLIKDKYEKNILYNKNNNRIEYKRYFETFNNNKIINYDYNDLYNRNTPKKKNNKTSKLNEINEIKIIDDNDIYNIDIKNISKIDINFPSINNIEKYNWSYRDIEIKKDKKNKVTTVQSICIKISIDEKKIKKIKQILNDEQIIKRIFKDEKILSYGYPFLKVGILQGILYEKKYYTFNKDNQLIISDNKFNNCEEKMYKDYEYIGLVINNIICLIEVIPIIFIDNGICVFDYNYRYLIPIEITSLLYFLENEEISKKKKYCSKDKDKNKDIKFDNNNYKIFLDNKKKLINKNNLDEKMLEKEKDIFYYDENLRNKPKKIDKNTCCKKTGKKCKKVNKFRNQSEIIENDLEINFKFKFDD